MRTLHYATATLVLAMSVLGCRTEPPALEPAPKPVVSAAATALPAGGGAVMAVVNGKPIYMDKLYEVLVRGQGLEMAQQLIVSEIVEQEAVKRKIEADDADLQAEHKRMLADVFPQVAELEQRERLLAQLLAERGWSRVRWELICRRNSLLRKMAEANAVVTEEAIKTEYGDQFGRKVVVRDIEVESLDEAERMMKALKDKADFAELARTHSKHASAAQGGLLPPLTRNGPPEDPWAAIRQVAFNLHEPGEVSEPVKVGYAFHLLKLEKFIEPTSMPLDQARERIAAALKDRLIRQWQQKILLDLMNASRYEFTDPMLREMKTKAEQAATPG